MKILVTGAAGFIGYFTALRLAQQGHTVVGLDNINDYYDVELKYGRLTDSGIKREDIQYNQCVQSGKYENYRFMKLNIEDRENLPLLFEHEKFDTVCHLAAQAGVRYSLENPFAYIESNVLGFVNVLEACRHHKIKNLVYASSSSVYGANKEMPFSTHHNVDHPVSLYAATKKSTELMAYTYSHLFHIPSTGLRFFTVYGPWGRPDMAIFKFVRNVIEGIPIDVYNHGKMQRDFTYIDDIVTGVIKTLETPAAGEIPYKIYNIGNNKPVPLMEFIETIETATGQKAEMNMMPLQPGDVPSTWADCSDLEKDFGYRPNTSLKDGVSEFVSWYRDFYGKK